MVQLIYLPRQKESEMGVPTQCSDIQWLAKGVMDQNMRASPEGFVETKVIFTAQD